MFNKNIIIKVYQYSKYIYIIYKKTKNRLYIINNNKKCIMEKFYCK